MQIAAKIRIQEAQLEIVDTMKRKCLSWNGQFSTFLNVEKYSLTIVKVGNTFALLLPSVAIKLKWCVSNQMIVAVGKRQ